MTTASQVGRPLYSTSEIRLSYDAQAEKSFDEKLSNPFFGRYGKAVGQTLAAYHPHVLLEVGCGDAYTLSHVISEAKPDYAFGLDCSPERIRIGEAWLRVNDLHASLSVGDMFRLPYPDNFADVVFTSHAIEPNGGREAEALRELYRVSGKWLVLFEPDIRKAPIEGQERMRRLNYCQFLADELRNYFVLRYERFSEIGNELNPTSLWVVRK